MQKDISPILVWGSVAIMAIGLLGVIVWRVRRWLMSADEGRSSPVFTLQDLREMRARGELSEAEFERIKAEIVGAYRASDAAATNENSDSRGV